MNFNNLFNNISIIALQNDHQLGQLFIWTSVARHLKSVILHLICFNSTYQF